MPLIMPSVSALPPSWPVLLRVERLCFEYPQRVLFKDLDASIPAGVTLVLGDDGSGKTTLLRLLAGELPAQAGHLQVRDASLQAHPQVYRQHIFWVDPQTQAFDALTPLQYFMRMRQIYPDFWPPEAPQLHELLAGLSLTEHLDKPLYMLSTGSRRKVWLAAAFAAGATVTLLDDPFAALDKPSIQCVLQQLAARASAADGACVVAHYEAPHGVALTQVIDLDA